MILRVHQSNFRTVGFVGRRRDRGSSATLGVPVIDDLGSGVLADGIDALPTSRPRATPSPPAPRWSPSAATSCSAARRPACSSARARRSRPAARHPLARALRVGRLPMAALAATLALYRDPERARREIPVLAMLDVAASPPAPRRAARRGHERRHHRGRSRRVGGGALPLLELHGPAVAVGPAPTRSPPGCAPRPAAAARIADGRIARRPPHAARRRRPRRAPSPRCSACLAG